MQLGAGNRTSDLLITRRPALPPELQLPQALYYYEQALNHYRSFDQFEVDITGTALQWQKTGEASGAGPGEKGSIPGIPGIYGTSVYMEHRH